MTAIRAAKPRGIHTSDGPLHPLRLESGSPTPTIRLNPLLEVREPTSRSVQRPPILLATAPPRPSEETVMSAPERVTGEDLSGQPESVPGPGWPYGQSPLTHGGARKGAGRKPQGEVAMVTTAFVITREQATWIQAVAYETKANKSQVVRAMIDSASLARVKSELARSR